MIELIAECQASQCLRQRLQRDLIGAPCKLSDAYGFPKTTLWILDSSLTQIDFYWTMSQTPATSKSRSRLLGPHLRWKKISFESVSHFMSLHYNVQNGFGLETPGVARKRRRTKKRLRVAGRNLGAVKAENEHRTKMSTWTSNYPLKQLKNHPPTFWFAVHLCLKGSFFGSRYLHLLIAPPSRILASLASIRACFPCCSTSHACSRQVRPENKGRACFSDLTGFPISS